MPKHASDSDVQRRVEIEVRRWLEGKYGVHLSSATIRDNSKGYKGVQFDAVGTLSDGRRIVAECWAYDGRVGVDGKSTFNAGKKNKATRDILKLSTVGRDVYGDEAKLVLAVMGPAKFWLERTWMGRAAEIAGVEIVNTSEAIARTPLEFELNWAQHKQGEAFRAG